MIYDTEDKLKLVLIDAYIIDQRDCDHRKEWEWSNQQPVYWPTNINIISHMIEIYVGDAKDKHYKHI